MDCSNTGAACAISQRFGGQRMCDREPAEACAAAVAEEVPVGFVYNDFPHAVMMATPDDLDDFAVGFSLGEGLIDDLAGIRAMSSRHSAEGIELAIDLAPHTLSRFLRRRRARTLRGHTSCGLCGIEDVGQLAVSLPSIGRTTPAARIDVKLVRSAVASLRDLQPLSRMTRCAHAAAWTGRSGEPMLVREDIGRHNALDKLIGACLRQGADTSSGFCLVTSRCSFEMVQKAVAARLPVLVAISAPTALAIRTARRAGLTLIAMDRDGRPIVYSGPQSGGERSRIRPPAAKDTSRDPIRPG